MMIISIFSIFSVIFSTPPQAEINFLFIIILSFANAFNLNQFKILSFGKELTNYHTIPHFDVLKYIAVENFVIEREIACKKQFLLVSMFSTSQQGTITPDCGDFRGIAAKHGGFSI